MSQQQSSYSGPPGLLTRVTSDHAWQREGLVLDEEDKTAIIRVGTSVCFPDGSVQPLPSDHARNLVAEAYNNAMSDIGKPSDHTGPGSLEYHYPKANQAIVNTADNYVSKLTTETLFDSVREAVPTLQKAAPELEKYFWAIDTLSGCHQFRMDDHSRSGDESVITYDDQKLKMSYPILTAQDSALVVSPTAQFFKTGGGVGNKDLSADQLEGLTQHVQSWWGKQLESVAGRVKIMKWLETGSLDDLAKLASEAKKSADEWAGQYTWKDILYNPPAETAQPFNLSLEDYVQPTLDELVSYLRPASDNAGKDPTRMLAAATNELLDKFGAECPPGSTIPSWFCTLETAIGHMSNGLRMSLRAFEKDYCQNRYLSNPPRERSVPCVTTDFDFANHAGGAPGGQQSWADQGKPARATHLKVYASTLAVAGDSGDSKPLTPLKSIHYVKIRKPRSCNDDASQNSSIE